MKSKAENRIQLHTNWQIQATSKIASPESVIFGSGFNSDDWHRAELPSTILGTLVKNGIFTDPFRGKNLAKIPEKMFAEPWWFRKEFAWQTVDESQRVSLEFDGVNYSAEVWLNGENITADVPIHGAFRRTALDITDSLISGKNILAVKVSPPKAGDFSIGFVDWNPPAPDKNMGIFRPVHLRRHHGVTLTNSFVQTRFNKDYSAVDLLITTELTNFSTKPKACLLQIHLDDTHLEKKVELQPGQRRRIALGSKEFPQLHFAKPRIWWPNNLGNPELYQVDLSVSMDDEISDTEIVTFGMRDIQSWLNSEGNRVFAINGKEILIKGAGWTDDLFLMDSDRSLEAQIRYVKDMNLNCIRLEGFWGKDHKLYDLCDQNGILIMVGWSCHWEHEQYLGKPIDARFGGVTEPDEIELVAQSFQDQVLWLRNHPSIFCWSLASDMVPHPDLEARYIDILQEYDTTRPQLNSTGGVGSDQNIITNSVIESDLTGSSGLKMLGPYAYTPPIYWYTDKNLGGAYGFNTETCPGANVPPIDSLRKMFTDGNLWPIGAEWGFHGGRNDFATLDRIVEAIRKRYGAADSVEDFAFKAQVLNYELMRPMFEAFQVNHPRATGIIQWMLNAAWPKTSWQLYDHYLRPNGAFFGAKKGCEPQHLVYNYGDGSIYFVNEFAENRKDLVAHIRQYDLQSTLIFEDRVALDPQTGPAHRIRNLAEAQQFSFLDLRLLHKNNSLQSHNFYWLPAQQDVLDYEAEFEDWAFYTPTKIFADFTKLNNLPGAEIHIQKEVLEKDDHVEIEMRITNASKWIAFFVEFNVVNSDTKESVLPIHWQDNYMSFLPEEVRNVKVDFPKYALGNARPEVCASGWNLDLIKGDTR
ncbi:MAG: glycoside hydrolase family 2 [Calditrichaeota bacterium]|nr:MAG: glycoside hydrolase family 2 [Calditrichota bacterium]